MYRSPVVTLGMIRAGRTVLENRNEMSPHWEVRLVSKIFEAMEEVRRLEIIGEQKKFEHFLYMMSDPRGRGYIGVTNDMRARLHNHRGGQYALGEAIRQFGIERFSINVLVIGERDYCMGLEPRAIRAFGTLVPEGYNLDPGGRGGPVQERPEI